MATTASYACLTVIYLYWSQKLHPIPLEVARLGTTLVVIIIVSVFAVFINTLDLTRWVELVKIILFILIIFIGFRLKLIPNDIFDLIKSFILEITGLKRVK